MNTPKQRKSERINFWATIEYICENSEYSFGAEVYNYSDGGACIETGYEMRPGSKIVIQVDEDQDEVLCPGIRHDDGSAMSLDPLYLTQETHKENGMATAVPDNTLTKYINDGQNKLTFNQVVDCALHGEQVCRSALEEVGENLGRGIADLANIFNPEMVVIGGAFSYGREILLPVIEETLSSETLPAVKEDLHVIFSEHGADACVLGAIAVVLDDILREVALV